MKTLLLCLAFCGALLGQNAAKYPGAVASQSDLGIATNRAETTLLVGINSSATSLSVASASQFRAGMYVTIDNEFLAICGVGSNTLTIGKSSCPNVDGRGIDTANGSSAAAPHIAGRPVQARISAWHHNQVAAEVEALEDALKNGIPHDVTFDGNTVFSGSTAVTWLDPNGSGPGVPDYRSAAVALRGTSDATGATTSSTHYGFFGGTTVGLPGVELDGYAFVPVLQRAASGTHPGPIIGTAVAAPIDGGGTATSATGAATLYVESDPPHTFSPSNWYSLWVNSGKSRFGNDINFPNADTGIHATSNSGSKKLIVWSDNGSLSLGALGAERATLSDSTLATTTNLTLTRSTPLVDLIGAEGSATTVRLQENAGYLNAIDVNAGSYLFRVSTAGLKADHGITIGSNLTLDTGGGITSAALAGSVTRSVCANSAGTLQQCATSAGLSVTKTVKGSDGSNCTMTFSAGILTATTCP